MSDPLITPDDLRINLSGGNIDVERALTIIEQAQQACESIVSPLPSTAAWIVMRVAVRGYVSTTSVRNAQQAAAGSPMGGSPNVLGGIWLSRSDIQDLRRIAGKGGAFTIDTLPANYATVLPPWDSNTAVYEGWYGDGWGGL